MLDESMHRWPEGEEYTSYSLAELLIPRAAPARPADFDDFWRETHAELTAIATDLRIECDESGRGRMVQRVSVSSSAGGRVLGWLVGPEPGRRVSRGLVISHGYGGRTEPDLTMVPADAAAIFPVAPWLPDNPGGLPSSEHVLIGIGDRYRYAHRFCVADIWRAATALLQRHPDAADRLDFRGGSFGGGIGALALPWDSRFRRATLDVPSFGDFPVRLSRPCNGSGDAVRRHLADHPGDRPMLDYFDAAIAAGSITIPVHVAVARMDPAVDPRGQFAVYHALAGPKRLVVCTAGHAEFDGHDEENAIAEADAQAFLAAATIPRTPSILRADTHSPAVPSSPAPGTDTSPADRVTGSSQS